MAEPYKTIMCSLPLIVRRSSTSLKPFGVDEQFPYLKDVFSASLRLQLCRQSYSAGFRQQNQHIFDLLSSRQTDQVNGPQ